MSGQRTVAGVTRGFTAGGDAEKVTAEMEKQTELQSKLRTLGGRISDLGQGKMGAVTGAATGR